MRFSTLFIITLCFGISQQDKKIEDAAFWTSVASQELSEALATVPNLNVARNVIVFVGDGMGPNTVTAARIRKGQLAGEGAAAERGHLRFERFPHIGLLKTYNADKQVSDSASTATALFCGAKANFKTVGLDATVRLKDCEASLNQSSRLPSIVRWAQDAGKRTGFVTNSRVTHATPAALYAHSAYRSWECEAKMPPSASKCKDIARQLIEDEPGKSLNVIFGGGRQCLVSNVSGSAADPIDTWACYRKDGLDLIAKWQQQKKNQNARYASVSNKRELGELDLSTLDHVLGVFANGFLPYEYERNDETSPSIAQLTRAAIQILNKGENGYVLVVEGGNIDQAHHRGTAQRALDETIALEAAVIEALGLIDPENTLVIVTADHSHTLAISGYPDRGNDILGVASKSKANALNYTTLSYATGTEIKYFAVNESYVSRRDPSLEDLKSPLYQQQTTFLTEEGLHGGNDVAVYAKGPWAHLFHSLHEQHYVAHVVGFASRIGPHQSSAATISSASMSIIAAVLIIHLN